MNEKIKEHKNDLITTKKWSFRLTRSLRPLSLFPRFNDGALITRTSAGFKSIVASPLNLRFFFVLPTQENVVCMRSCMWVLSAIQHVERVYSTIQLVHSNRLTNAISFAKAYFVFSIRCIRLCGYDCCCRWHCSMPYSYEWFWSKQAAAISIFFFVRLFHVFYILLFSC